MNHIPAADAWRLTAVVSGLTLLSVFPPFALAARRAAVTGEVALFFAAAAVATTPALARRAPRLVGPAVVVSGLSTLAVGALPTTSDAPFAAVLTVGGLAGGLLSAGVVSIAGTAHPSQRARALTSVAAASLAAPLVVSATIATVASAGWRPTVAPQLLGTGVATLAAVLVRPAHGHGARVVEAPGPPWRSRRAGQELSWRVVAVALGAAASNHTALVLVPMLTEAGLRTATAGRLGAAAATVALAVRVLIALRSEQLRSLTRMAIPLLVVGGASCLLLAEAPALVTPFAAVGIAVGSWTWTGLVLVSTHAAPDPDAAGVAVQRAVLMGAAAAPAIAATGTGVEGSLLACALSLWTAAALLVRPLTAADGHDRTAADGEPRPTGVTT